VNILCFLNKRGRVINNEFLEFISIGFFKLKAGAWVLEWQMGVIGREMSMERRLDPRPGRERHSHVGAK